MRKKELEIIISKNVKSFLSPKINLEQYQTPPDLASTLVHRAFILGDINNKSVADFCAGTGILGIAASLMGGFVSFYEIDKKAIDILNKNSRTLELNIEIFNENILEMNVDKLYDTIIINPPFGIQQKKLKDMDFIKVAKRYGKVIYSIHDGSDSNKEILPELFKRNNLKITEMYYHKFLLRNTYHWHKYRKHVIKVLVIRSELV